MIYQFRQVRIILGIVLVTSIVKCKQCTHVCVCARIYKYICINFFQMGVYIYNDIFL